LPQILQVARSVDRRLNRILSFVLVYNAAGILLAVSGLLHPVFAALLMLGSSATVLQMSAKSDETES
jgi:Cu2+-exporting ATPase/Cu+-exporting ATPase